MQNRIVVLQKGVEDKERILAQCCTGTVARIKEE